MRGNRWLVAGALALVMSFVGCDCGENPSTPNDDAGVVDGQDGGTDGGNTLPDGGPIPDGGDGTVLDGGPGSQCVAAGAICSRDMGAQCCTGVCGTDNRCPEPNPLCLSAGESCTSGVQCCTNVCGTDGKCGSTQCLDIGGSCTSANAGQCCTKTCGSDGKCAPIPSDTTSVCKVVGQGCTGDGDCCSTNCQAGICARAYSCQGYNDICTSNMECCGNACSANADGGVGRCQFITGGGGGGCIQDGNPCSGGSGCCSRTCVDLGYGATVCQPVGGCKLTGNFCTKDSDCCGGGKLPDGGVINPNGTVTCNNGRCDNGQSCNGVGNICGAGTLPDGGSVDINASQNCCDGKKAVCKVDSSGVPRCFGGLPTGGGGGGSCSTGYTGETGCCIASGATCQFSDQCCDGALCLPAGDGTGRLSCQKPTCAPVGTPCDSASVTCCAGTQCLATSELTKACQVPTTPTPSDGGTPSTDGGTTSDGGTGGVCKANGSTCSGGTQCCSGICSSGTCQAPEVCQPQNGACTSSSDCCLGLRCDIPLGSTTGSCQPGATCSTSGQACSPTTSCCSGLACRNSSGLNCDGTSACVCQVPIN